MPYLPVSLLNILLSIYSLYLRISSSTLLEIYSTIMKNVDLWSMPLVPVLLTSLCAPGLRSVVIIFCLSAPGLPCTGQRPSRHLASNICFSAGLLSLLLWFSFSFFSPSSFLFFLQKARNLWWNCNSKYKL